MRKECPSNYRYPVPNIQVPRSKCSAGNLCGTTKFRYLGTQYVPSAQVPTGHCLVPRSE